jgi:hypothetical protein
MLHRHVYHTTPVAKAATWLTSIACVGTGVGVGVVPPLVRAVVHAAVPVPAVLNIPEPSSIALLIAPLLVLAMLRRIG